MDYVEYTREKIPEYLDVDVQAFTSDEGEGGVAIEAEDGDELHRYETIFPEDEDLDEDVTRMMVQNMVENIASVRFK